MIFKSEKLQEAIQEFFIQFGQRIIKNPRKALPRIELFSRPENNARW
jgi:hypothetical protein